MLQTDRIFRQSLNAFEPAAGFRFLVQVDGKTVGAFTDCKLPTVSWKTQEITEGGLNTHTHELIGQRKKSKMTLKRGVAISKDLTVWYAATLNQIVDRRTVDVMVLDHQRRPVITWSIQNAFPLKWQGPKLQTKAKTIAIESLTLSCGLIRVFDDH